MEKATLTNEEARTVMDICKTTFYAMKATGQFDHLLAPVPERFSREKVEAWIAGRLPRRAPRRPMRVAS